MTIGAVAIASGPIAGPEGAAQSSTAATPTVAVLFETADGVYLDIGEQYRAIETFRGRNRELDRYQAGTCRVVLDDRTRMFDPMYTGSPLYPYVKPMRGVQITATWDGVTYPIFTGTVDSIEHEYAGPAEGDATATLFCTDGFKVLEAAGLDTSAYAEEVAADGPVAWWRLDEQGGTVAYDHVGDHDLTAVGAPELGAATLIARDPGAAAAFADSETGFRTEGQFALTGGPLTIEAVIRSDIGAQAGNVVALFSHFAGSGAVLYADENTGFIVAKTPGGFVSTDISGTPILEDGLVHHIAGVWNDDGTLKIYIDGVDRTVGTPSLAVGDFDAAVGFTQINGDPDLESGLLGATDEVAFYDYALSVARIQAHAAAVTLPWDGDTPAERLDRILDAAAWPDALRSIDPGTSTLQSAELNMSTLEHAQKVADSDFGLLFIAADGSVRFIGRDGLFNLPQMATFGDDVGELGYRELTPEFTDQLIRNDVTVSRNEGVAQRVEDPTSIGEYLRHSYVTDGLIHDSDTLSRSAAEFLVAEYKDPLRRISNLMVTPRGDPANLFPQVLGRELADQITVIDRPPGGGDPNEQDSAIEGVGHTITPMFWETRWNLAPSFGSAAGGCVLELDTGLCGLDDARLGF